MRWKNNLGWTEEIARSPGDDSQEFDWRISIAEIESDCAFSSFAGYTRSIFVLDGNGMDLVVDDKTHRMQSSDQAFVQFAGAANTSCQLLNGPTRDINVMTRDAACSHQAQVLRGGLVHTVELPNASIAGFYCPYANATLECDQESYSLAKGDYAIIQAFSSAKQLTISCIGKIMCVVIANTSTKIPN